MKKSRGRYHVSVRLVCTILLLLVTALSAGVAGDAFILPKGTTRIGIYGGSVNASNYYDVDGSLRLFDSVQTRFVATVFGLNASYGLTDNLELNFDMPVGYYQLSSRSRFPDRSIFSPTYFGIGATYQLKSDNLIASLSSMLKIPPGFHRGIYDDPNHPSFLSDGYFQLVTALNVGFNFKDVWVKGSAGYNWRDEEPLDEIVYSAEVGLSRVEGTGIFAGAEGVVSTGDATQPARPFYAGASSEVTERLRISGGTGRFSTIDRENYFGIYAGAFVDVTDHISLNGRYTLRLFGVNSLSLQGGWLGLTYKF